MEKFGDRLARIIEEKGMKQSEFCEEIGYSPQKLSNIVTGKTLSPRIDILHLIAKRYSDIDIRWLLIGEETSTDLKADSNLDIEIPPTTITQTQYQDLLRKIDQLSQEVEELKRDVP